MTTYPPLGLNSPLGIGKYKGEGLGSVIDKDPKYVAWMVANNAIDVRKEVVNKLKEAK